MDLLRAIFQTKYISIFAPKIIIGINSYNLTIFGAKVHIFAIQTESEY